MFLSRSRPAVMKGGKYNRNNLSVAEWYFRIGAHASKHGRWPHDTLREECGRGHRVIALLSAQPLHDIWTTLWPKRTAQ